MGPTAHAPQLSQGYPRTRPSSGTSRSNFPSQQYQYSNVRPSGHGHGTRPTSAGATRVHSNDYSRGNLNTLNFLNGSRGPGVVGSGYSARPSSAGATRGHHHHSSSKHRHHSGGSGSSGSGFPSSRHGTGSGGSHSTSRPKSAGSTRRSSRDHTAQDKECDRLPDPKKTTLATADMNTTRLWSAQKHIVQTNNTSAANDVAKGNYASGGTPGAAGQEHWSSSYKQSYGTANAPHFKVNSTQKAPVQTAPVAAVAKGASGAAPVQNHINMAATRTSKDARDKGSSRVRTAIQNSQQYTASTESGTANTAGEGSTGAEPAAEVGNIGTETGDVGGPNDDFEGKAIPSHMQSQETRTQPEVSLTTPSQSTVLVGAPEGGIDTRNGSLDSFHEDKMSVGLQTVPNQFCSAREALELKKLLLLSNGSRGGIVPSSTAVMDMYMVGKVIGVGSYGKVRAAWHRLTGGKVAIKTYDKSKLRDPAHWKRVHSEIKITEQVSHPRIARMYEAVETPKRMHLIMECLDGGNLCSYVKAKRRLAEEEAKAIFFQLMQGIEHLHQMRVTHRDVKLENVLFDSHENRDIKLIDFGFSTVCEPGSKLKVFCGTPSYMAPEIVRRTEYEGKPVDMWSMGILLYALLCGCFPFRAKSYPDLYRRIARGTFAMPEELSVSVRDLIRQLLNVDASRRMTSAAALRHPWLQAPLAAAPDMAKLRLVTPILISDRAEDDIDEETLEQLSKFGLGREEVLRQVMSKTHSALATLYYLLLNVVMNKKRVSGKSRSSHQGSSNSTSNSRPRRPQSSGAVRPSHDPSTNHNHRFAVNGAHNTTATPTATTATPTQTVQEPRVAQGLGAGMTRPRSASATRSSGHAARPLSTYTGRHHPHESG